jgi:hypothetical protein
MGVLAGVCLAASVGAPMQQKVTADSEREEDLEKLRALGFNTVRTSVEGNVREPPEREYHLENLPLRNKSRAAPSGRPNFA